MDRTVRIRLDPTRAQADALVETARQFTDAFNLVCAHGWGEGEKNGVRRAYITYKAEERGIRVEGVDPRHTSQGCSRCGFQSRYNRRSQSEFWCRQCGYRLNADLNGARNIATKLLAGGGMTAAGGPPSIGLSCPAAEAVAEAQAVCFS